ncbi:arylsulfatase [Algoriphagus yeomjeoni]|uniref:Arylsulfatase A-like enzyme n=1 Tax=Algoriphagus yeomjeoni TaxID=291403 RepID=A0A327PE16_9BACT|nr:arylsulfatase [Algoriphagus yeomjeoni]RAI89322.1 arylsulfatase A-like enzyme [Algoriphagus yeomjeoni]
MKIQRSIFILLLFASQVTFSQQTTKSPNVILIITDDQGYGDLGSTGNPHINTPTLDAFAAESVRFTNFYVSPVCAPTRASLMTGRYSLRTGVRDTYNGGAMMASSEITIAELLKSKDYATGIFGKWHLGDNYPMRPSDQGFDESLIHLSGGMGQVGDFTTYYQGDRSYFDPVLWHNNQQESYEGYCSDIFAGEAIKFIEKNKDKPFFTYLAFNAPHTPLQVPDEYYQKYKDIDPSLGFGTDGKPFYPMSENNKEDARKVYAMVENIDDNLRKLFQKLEELGIEDNTIVIFMTDNGPQQQRYVAGLKGLKGNVFQGGVRAPFFIRYPNGFKGNKEINTLSAHLDVLPTLADLCGFEVPKDRKVDGQSLLPLIQGQNASTIDRSYFAYWTRKYPELYQNISIQKAGWKLVGNTDYNSEIEKFNLYNLNEDPYELNNLSSKNVTKATELKSEMDAIYLELINEKNQKDPPIIHVGNASENPIFLNRNDAAGERGIWAQEDIFGYWNVSIEPGIYDIRVKFIKPVPPKGRMTIETSNYANIAFDRSNEEVDIFEMKGVSLQKTKGQLLPFYEVKGQRYFPFWIELEKK